MKRDSFNEYRNYYSLKHLMFFCCRQISVGNKIVFFCWLCNKKILLQKPKYWEDSMGFIILFIREEGISDLAIYSWNEKSSYIKLFISDIWYLTCKHLEISWLNRNCQKHRKPSTKSWIRFYFQLCWNVWCVDSKSCHWCVLKFCSVSCKINMQSAFVILLLVLAADGKAPMW